jgi:hypothetical protein
MRFVRWSGFVVLLACAGCGGFHVGCGVDAPPAASSEAETALAEAHGDHSPHQGGVVMMKGDLHYEVVLDARGRYRLYFTDAMRADLPAAAAAIAAITIMRPNEAPEGIQLQIDESGESWIGEGRPVTNVSATQARVAFTIRGEEPYWIDLPFDIKTDATQPHQ